MFMCNQFEGFVRNQSKNFLDVKVPAVCGYFPRIQLVRWSKRLPPNNVSEMEVSLMMMPLCPVDIEWIASPCFSHRKKYCCVLCICLSTNSKQRQCQNWDFGQKYNGQNQAQKPVQVAMSGDTTQKANTHQKVSQHCNAQQRRLHGNIWPRNEIKASITTALDTTGWHRRMACTNIFKITPGKEHRRFTFSFQCFLRLLNYPRQKMPCRNFHSSSYHRQQTQMSQVPFFPSHVPLHLQCWHCMLTIFGLPVVDNAAANFLLRAAFLLPPLQSNLFNPPENNSLCVW